MNEGEDRAQGFSDFKEFYQFYVTQHKNRKNQFLHLIGAIMSILSLLISLFHLSLIGVLLSVLWNYLFSWSGHFCFEGNHPVSFKHPFYSIRASYILSYEFVLVALGKRKRIGASGIDSDALITEE